MVYQIIRSKWGIFIEALVLTVLVFNTGLFVGYLIESSRTNDIASTYKSYEIESIDLRLQNYYFQTMDNQSCAVAIEENFIFADDLYNKGLELERYEEANQITGDLLIEKKRYVLLKTQLWLNSIELKKKCNKPFDTVVYFYSGDPGNSLTVAQQKSISNVLKTVKEDKGNSIVLLPIAGDLRLRSVDTQMRAYNVTSLPAILINEKEVLYGFHDVNEILNLVNRSS